MHKTYSFISFSVGFWTFTQCKALEEPQELEATACSPIPYPFWLVKNSQEILESPVAEMQ